MFSGHCVTAAVNASAPEAVFPEVETLTAEAVEGRDEELFMDKGAATGHLSTLSSLNAKTKHKGKRVWTRINSSRNLFSKR